MLIVFYVQITSIKSDSYIYITSNLYTIEFILFLRDKLVRHNDVYHIVEPNILNSTYKVWILNSVLVDDNIIIVPNRFLLLWGGMVVASAITLRLVALRLLLHKNRLKCITSELEVIAIRNIRRL